MLESGETREPFNPDQHRKDYLGFTTDEQLKRYDQFMGTSMDKWPEPLRTFVEERITNPTVKPGFAMAYAIAEWLKEGN